MIWQGFGAWLSESLQTPDLCFLQLLCSGVIRQERPLRRTGPHGEISVHQEVRKAGCEVRDKVVGDGAQGLLYLDGQLSVMMFLLR